MAENEFEKKVRTEMDEFKVHPSGEVWPKIEERIREKNRRRRIVFFVLFSAIALLLAGYGVYNFSMSHTKLEAEHKLPENDRSNDERKNDNPKNNEASKETITIKPNITDENSDGGDTAFIVAPEKQLSRSRKANNHVAFIPERSSSQKDDVAIEKTNNKEQNDMKSDSAGQTTAGVSSFQQQSINTNPRQNEIAENNKNLTVGDTTVSKVDEATAASPVQVVKGAKKESHAGKTSWGINFSPGSSVITEDAFSLKGANASADMAYSAPPPSTGGGPVTYYRYGQAQNKPAFALKVGVHVRQYISKRSSLSAGLGYSYLADKIEVGTASGQLYSQSARSTVYSGAPNQTYTDRFHFLELPISYNWRITNNTDHFLSINVGVAPSYLIATNALLYDTTGGGIYYQNKDLITKAHLNIISGLSYQFKNKNNLEFSIGPQFSFDVSKAFNSELDKRRYFLYTGIDARIYFEKKNK